MKSIKKALHSLSRSKRGKPRFLNRLLFLSTHEKYFHHWISNNMGRNDVVLDVGAELFPYTRYQKLKALFGVDIPSKSRGYLGWTKIKLKNIIKAKSIYPIWGTCEELPFKDNSFDKIIMTEVIEHIEKDELAISELARVTKKSGKLFITTPNGNEVANTNPYHIRHYKPNELKRLLEKNFQKVDIQLKFPNPKLFLMQHQPKNNILLLRIFWRYSYEIWHEISGHKYPNEGYTITATCSYPNKKAGKALPIPKNLDIIVCPKCKGKLKKISKNKRLFHFCNVCEIHYPLKQDIPYLIRNIYK